MRARAMHTRPRTHTRTRAAQLDGKGYASVAPEATAGRRWSRLSCDLGVGLDLEGVLEAVDVRGGVAARGAVALR